MSECFLNRIARTVLRPPGAFAADRKGASAVEFAFVAPVLVLLLGGAADFGAAIKTKFALANAVAAASSYALDNFGMVNSTNGAGLSATLASLLASSYAANWANASVVLNDGPTAAVTSGAATAGGSAAGADSCYCPTGSKAAISWGAPVSCGTTCASSLPSGKYVVLTASRSFTPLLLPASLFASAMTATGVVQVQ